MKTALTLLRLARMRRDTGAGRLTAITWAGGLLLRSHLRATAERRNHP